MTQSPCLTSPLLLLAGGASSRMGQPKALLMIHEKPWILHQAESWFQAGGERLLIVCTEEIKETLDPLFRDDKRIKLLVQTTPRAPMAASLALGVQELSNPQSLFLLPIDVPAPVSQDWQRMENCLSSSIDAVLPHTGGHPVLLCHPLLLRLKKGQEHSFRLDKELEQSRERKAVAFCNGEFAFARMNMNTPADWQDWLANQNLEP